MYSAEATGKDSGYGAADIHIHSNMDDGMASVPDILAAVADRGDLDVIAITDHNEISGSYQTRELASKLNYPFEVVTGMEVNTIEGHLLALFIEHPVPAYQPLVTAIAAIHDQGGLAIVPHPMNWLTDSIGQRDMEKMDNSSEPDIYLDGIETVNAAMISCISNQRVKTFNLKYKLAETGGSDAHFLAAVGSGLTLFPDQSSKELERSIRERTTRAENGTRVRLRNIGLIQILRQQRRSRGYFLVGVLKNSLRRFSS